MKPVDSIMERCPLKHEIRVSFWGPFIRRLAKIPIRYLTLYSPPLMDVKYFSQLGYILKGDKYSNVVGVTNDKDAYAAANKELDKRLG